jgi:DNA-binding response OmpR family regulator
MSKKILIIEDDPDILELMAYILEDEGYQVTAALDCKPLDQIASIKPDLILLDNRLGGTLGSDACKSSKRMLQPRIFPSYWFRPTCSLNK